MLGQVGVVHELPVACAQVYMGQTGKCFNATALGDKRDVKNKVANSFPSKQYGNAPNVTPFGIRILATYPACVLGIYRVISK